MDELRSTVIHHIAQAALKAGVRFDQDCRAELEADFAAAERRIQLLEKRVAGVEALLVENVKRSVKRSVKRQS